MIRGRSAGVTFVVCVVAGVLVGCDGQAESQPTTSAVASPSGSTSASVPSSPSTTTSSIRPTPTPTAAAKVPAAAGQPTAAGAEAFARFYLELVNRAWSEANPDLLQPFVLPSAACR